MQPSCPATRTVVRRPVPAPALAGPMELFSGPPEHQLVGDHDHHAL